MTDERTPGEMWRRMDAMTGEMRSGFKGVNERLDKVPTTGILEQILLRYDLRMNHLEDDVKELNEKIEDIDRDIKNTRRWSIGTVIAIISVILPSVALIRTLVAP